MKHVYIFNTVSRAAEYGIGTCVQLLISSLEDTEISVTVVYICTEDNELCVRMVRNIRYISIPRPLNLKFLPKSDEQREQDDLISQSVALILLPFVNTDEDNIFHLNSMASCLLASKLKEYYGGFTVLTVHCNGWSFEFNGDKNKLFRLLKEKEVNLNYDQKQIVRQHNIERDLINNYVDKVIAISQHAYNDLVTIYGADKSKLIRIDNAIEDKYKSLGNKRKFSIRKHFEIAEDEMIIIYAGRLDEGKGVDILIRAFKQVFKKNKNIRLIIAGDGEFRNLIKSASPLWTKVTFTGFLSKRNLYQLYSIGDIGVIPSSHETFGYVTIEMMMHKLPVIVTNTTGSTEIVDDGVNGFKVELGTLSERGKNIMAANIAFKLNILVQNAELRKKIGIAGRKKFKTHYESRLFHNQILNFYESVNN